MKSRLPEGWGIVKLKEIVTVHNGRAFKRNELLETGKYKVIRVGNFYTNREIKYSNLELDEDKYCINNDLLYAWSANFGPEIWEGNKAIYHYHIWKLDNFKETKRMFLYYNLLHTTVRLKQGTHGSVYSHLTKEYFENFEIKLPGIREQKAIAKTLSALDDKIENNNKINENLEAQAQEIFKHWFVDFEYPDQNGMPYKSSGGEMEESELGTIPKGWKVKKLNELLGIYGGFTFKSKNYVMRGNYKVLTIKNVQDGYINTKSFNEIENLPEKFNNKAILNKGDILVSLTGNVGRTAIVYGQNWLLNQRVAKLIPKNEKNKTYFYILFRSDQFKKLAESIASGTAQKNLSSRNLLKTKIAANGSVMNDFNDNIQSMIDKIISNNIENTKLSELRDTLLPKLMSGELRIPLDE